MNSSVTGTGHQTIKINGDKIKLTLEDDNDIKKDETKSINVKRKATIDYYNWSLLNDVEPRKMREAMGGGGGGGDRRKFSLNHFLVRTSKSRNIMSNNELR